MTALTEQQTKVYLADLRRIAARVEHDNTKQLVKRMRDICHTLGDAEDEAYFLPDGGALAADIRGLRKQAALWCCQQHDKKVKATGRKPKRNGEEILLAAAAREFKRETAVRRTRRLNLGKRRAHRIRRK